MSNFSTLRSAVAETSSSSSDGEALARAAAEPLSEALDAQRGASVTDRSIFDAHARKFEASWMEDMDALGVRPPDALTRVTEYVPEIVSFISGIVARGLAYESGGSIYMDLAAFRRAGHAYPKLQPSKGVATAAEMEESEGSHTAAVGEKKGAGDFALWKASKAGEPAWESPWGGGRPGWHIECSVMASELLGSNMDVHAGGVDLQFPHHDNELCQVGTEGGGARGGGSRFRREGERLEGASTDQGGWASTNLTLPPTHAPPRLR
jgi:cysteinyl-tRNA synthetase